MPEARKGEEKFKHALALAGLRVRHVRDVPSSPEIFASLPEIFRSQRSSGSFRVFSLHAEADALRILSRLSSVRLIDGELGTVRDTVYYPLTEGESQKTNGFFNPVPA